MSDKMDVDSLHALKVAFSYMPKAIEVTRFEYGERYDVVLKHIETVRQILEHNGVDPEEVDGEINEDIAPNSCY
ncbi:penicillin-binding protein [Bacterioplanes sanyensis]|uniref:Penicillin-binding protein n=1 Tax=Bacterioplanes sanyensis TaxID=1249553 RepID=A0A222FLH6_9GAMM|nr:penicillin-binding protein [Bacterioplanes sanyensis]ASP39073.1 penicillin-binding protein [Bacterioplanes sanyensis]